VSRRALNGLVLAALLVVTGVCMWCWPGSRGAPVVLGGVDAAEGADGRVELVGQESTGTRHEPMDVLRTPMAKPALRGRCLAAESGEPLAGVVVRLGRIPRRQAQPPRHEAPDAPLRDPLDPNATDSPSVATTEDGRFRLECDPQRDHVVNAWFTADHRLPLVSKRIYTQRGGEWDLGDIALELGTRLTARVVDAVGQPVPDVQLSLVGYLRPDTQQPIRPVPGSPTCSSNDQGQAVFADLVPCGAWEICTGPSFETKSLINFQLAPGELERVLTVRLEGVLGPMSFRCSRALCCHDRRHSSSCRYRQCDDIATAHLSS
jgi:hypothetical protein